MGAFAQQKSVPQQFLSTMADLLREAHSSSREILWRRSMQNCYAWIQVCFMNKMAGIFFNILHTLVQCFYQLEIKHEWYLIYKRLETKEQQIRNSMTLRYLKIKMENLTNEKNLRT